MSDPVTVLEFWLGEIGPKGWYAGGAELDAQVRDGFADLWQVARDGGIEHWIEGTAGTLAYIVVTDQFPRNMWRDTLDAFATDALALAAAKRAVDAGWDIGSPEPDRQFFYLPYMHAENDADQAECIALFAERMPDTGADNLLHARAHAEVIRCFGRFPTRNAALGRQTTPAEAAYLAEGGYGAVLEALRG